MAIVKMKQVSICGLKSDRKAVLEKVQQMGVMEVRDLLPEDMGLVKTDTASQRRRGPST